MASAPLPPSARGDANERERESSRSLSGGVSGWGRFPASRYLDCRDLGMIDPSDSVSSAS